MIVVYSTILQRIRTAIRESREQGKDIAYIALDSDEWVNFKKDLTLESHIPFWAFTKSAHHDRAVYDGVEIRRMKL